MAEDTEMRLRSTHTSSHPTFTFTSPSSLHTTSHTPNHTITNTTPTHLDDGAAVRRRLGQLADLCDNGKLHLSLSYFKLCLPTLNPAFLLLLLLHPLPPATLFTLFFFPRSAPCLPLRLSFFSLLMFFFRSQLSSTIISFFQIAFPAQTFATHVASGFSNCHYTNFRARQTCGGKLRADNLKKRRCVLLCRLLRKKQQGLRLR